MKQLLLLVLCFFALANSQAQIVNIPDANFKAKLLEASSSNQIAEILNYGYDVIDYNYDGEIQVYEAEEVISLNLNFSEISDLTGIEAFINLEKLECRQNQISVLDLSQNTQLVELDMLWNNISNFNFSSLVDLEILSVGDPLIDIDLSQNLQLKNLYLASSSINSLDISNNVSLEMLRIIAPLISTLDLASNINLISLGLSNLNSLNSIDISHNTNLQVFDSSDVIFTSVDLSQNLNLVTFRCINGQLTALDLTNNALLEHVRCDNNFLTEIDISQNPLLQLLDITNNQITSLDASGNLAINSLRLNNNLISEIDVSQNQELYSLEVANNQLVSVDLSNNFLINFANISSNESLVYVNIKNGNIDELVQIFNNPNLETVCIDSNELSNGGVAIGPSVVPLSEYCTFIPGGDYNIISGYIIFDSDDNGCDTNDLSYPNLRLDISDGMDSGITFSNNAGEYTFYTNEGTYDIIPNIENPSWFSVSPSNVQIPFIDLNNTVNQDFCITPNGTHNDLEIVIVPIVAAQPGFDASYQIVYKNKGNQVLSGSVDFTYNDSVLDLISTSAVPDIQTPGNMSWNYADLNPFERRTIDVVFNVNSPMETPAVNIDDVLDFTAVINPISGDEIPNDNTFRLEQVVIGSYDPNDITCLESGTVAPEKIGEYLHYNIRFENTGTAPTSFVVVKDIIDGTKFDLSSFQVMHSSHDMATRITNSTVEFLFETLSLGPNEMGNIVFKIKTLDTLSVGDSVAQQAEIFFDFNFPIETNNAETSFQLLSIEDTRSTDSFVIFPNPSKDRVTIEANSTIESITLYDVQGRELSSISVNALIHLLDISNYRSGIYFLEVSSLSGNRLTQQLIKK
ncbi:DUF7619 domain-containing protein [Winogradskyella flava]|uniref:T9SS type A sorting domain-containing protein n=1 Tax=Winogradskyella flava TaxID=1884876 RepID=A0A842IU93_9FLAO|nr:T9SS type A sorting domain-containing protein [Winogradskyella flava]MBC2846630.1 T9SS type A sorting domain-containing protein [Winogradskyella flava]